MAKPYSNDLRERVVKAVEGGQPQNSVAKMFKIGIATVERYMARWRRSESVKPDKFGGHLKFKLAEHAGMVKALVKAEPDATLAELQTRLSDQGIEVSVAALHRFLRAEKITYKKNPVRHGTKTSRRR
jgi:putative transposase